MCWMYLRNSGCIWEKKKNPISFIERRSEGHDPSWNPRADLLGQQRDEVFGFPLQVQLHVVQLAVEGFVDLLLPLQTAGLLHGPLHAGPVQVAGQVSQDKPHVLGAVQGDAQLAESKEEEEEEKRRDRGWRRRHKGGKEAGLQRNGGAGRRREPPTAEVATLRPCR